MTIIDYPRPIAGADLATAGVTGVVRYWPKEHGSTEVVGLTATEIADLVAHGVALATIYEDTAADWMSGGFPAGVAAGRWLQGQFAATGHTPRCVYLAADSTTLSSAAVNACLDGAASVLGHSIVGLYAFAPQLIAAQSGGHASWYWLCGHYAPQPWMHLYQCNGSQPSGPTSITVARQTCDVDIPLTNDWGQSIMTAPNSSDDDAVLGYLAGNNRVTMPDGQARNVFDCLYDVSARLMSIQAAVTALATAVTGVDTDVQADAKQVLAAVAAQPAGASVDVTALANQLAPLLSASEGAALIAALKTQFDK